MAVRTTAAQRAGRRTRCVFLRSFLATGVPSSVAAAIVSATPAVADKPGDKLWSMRVGGAV